ncbi:MAG: chemotaxis protein CheW [bacterium]
MVEGKRAEELQLVIFQLTDEEYAIPIIQVHEIIKPTDVTRIPGMPDFVEGVINLRGKVIPIIDIRKRFRLQRKKADEDTRVIVVDVGEHTVGLIVDSVTEVLRLSLESIDPVPTAIAKISSEYLRGIGKLKERLLIILDVEKMLTELEKISLEKAKEKLSETEKKEETEKEEK